MPKYEVIKDSYIDQPDPQDKRGVSPRIVRKGQQVSFLGWPGTSLEPIDAEAKRRAGIVEEYRKLGKKLPATVEDYDKEQAAAAKAAKATKTDKAA